MTLFAAYSGYENYASFEWCAFVSNDWPMYQDFHAFMDTDPNDGAIRQYIRDVVYSCDEMKKSLREWARECNTNLPTVINSISIDDVREEATP